MNKLRCFFTNLLDKFKMVPASWIFYRWNIKYIKNTRTKRIHRIPANTAHPDPFCKVVLLLIKNTIAEITNRTMAKPVIIIYAYLGRNRVSNRTIRLSPTEIKTPQSKN